MKSELFYLQQISIVQKNYLPISFSSSWTLKIKERGVMNCSRFNVKELKCPKLTYNGRSEVVSALTGGVAANYAYDAVGNRLVSTSLPNGRVSVLYCSGYDGLDRRVWKRVYLPSEASHWYYYNGWNPVVEKITPSGGTTATVRYV